MVVKKQLFLGGAVQVFRGAVAKKQLLFEVKSGEDASPLLCLPLPPQTPLACSRQDWTGLSERQRSARTRSSHAGLRANLGLPPQDCTVGIAFCDYATNKVDKDALMLSCSIRNAQAHKHTHSHTQYLAPLFTHTCTHTKHTNIHTRAHTHTHTHTHAQAPRAPKSRLRGGGC